MSSQHERYLKLKAENPRLAIETWIREHPGADWSRPDHLTYNLTWAAIYDKDIVAELETR